MKRWRRVVSGILIALLAVTPLGLAGCFGSGGEGGLALGSAKIAPPEIAREGVLRVGVDSSRAPFAGLSNGKIIGIDVDIAAALAEEMGLKLDVVDIRDQDVSSLLQNGTIDVAMGIQGESSTPGTTTTGTATVPYSESRVGPYLVDGPAVFTVGVSDAPSSLDLTQLAGVKIAAQEGSLSAWQVGKDFNSEDVVTFPTLNAAFDQLSDGAVSYAAADAIVGSFLAITYENIRCEGLLTEPKGIYMGVATGKTELASQLTEALRVLRDKGNLQIIIAKWLGPVSAQTVLSNQAIVTLAGANGTNPASGADGMTPDQQAMEETIEGTDPNAEGSEGSTS